MTPPWNSPPGGYMWYSTSTRPVTAMATDPAFANGFRRAGSRRAHLRGLDIVDKNNIVRLRNAR